MSKISLLKKLVKGTAAGGVAGYAASYSSSSAAESPENARRGLAVGSVVGAGLAGAIPMARSKTLRDASNAAGKVVFRRFKGRIIPVRKK